jgi:hypothetical protein
MSDAAQVYLVIVTIALLPVAWWAVSMMRRLGALDRNVRAALTRLEVTIDRARGRTGEAMSLLDGLRERADGLTATAAGVEHAGARAARILSLVLGGFERPAHRAIGVARGVRAGMRYLEEGRRHEHVGFEPAERV